MATLGACTRAEVDQMIGGFKHFAVVFHHDKRIAQISQPFHGTQKAAVVPWVETNGRFVEHVENAREAGSNLTCQTDPLTLSTRKGWSRTRHGEILEADLHKESEPVGGLSQQISGNFGLLAGVVQAAHEFEEAADGPSADLVEREAFKPHGSGIFANAGPKAGWAIDLADHPSNGSTEAVRNTTSLFQGRQKALETDSERRPITGGFHHG